jgi:hypothetical protein
MALDTVAKLPGKKDINNQFTVANLHKTLDYYNSIKQTNGDYTFGELTNKWYKAGAQWMTDVKLYPTDAQEQIKQCIIKALTNKDKDGNDHPIPVTLKWSDGNKAVNCTYDPSPPSYTIEIIGYPQPPASLLAQRRGKKKT